MIQPFNRSAWPKPDLRQPFLLKKTPKRPLPTPIWILNQYLANTQRSQYRQSTMDNTPQAQASADDNEDPQANATTQAAEPSDDASSPNSGPSTSNAEAGETQPVPSAPPQDQQTLALLQEIFSGETAAPNLEDLLALSEDLRTFDVSLHQIERACANFMGELDRNSLTPDVREAVALGDQAILRCQLAHALRSLAILTCNAELAGGQAMPLSQRVEWGLYRLDLCKKALISLRQGLSGREFQLWALGEAVLYAEVQHDLVEWALRLTQTTTRFIDRRPWLRSLIGDLSSRQSLEAVCEVEVDPEPQEQDHPGTGEDEARDLDGDCMICATPLTPRSTESVSRSQSLLATCLTCNQALHLPCILTWWRMPATQPQARKCPLCRAIVTDEYYVEAVKRQTAWLAKAMDNPGNGN